MDAKTQQQPQRHAPHNPVKYGFDPATVETSSPVVSDAVDQQDGGTFYPSHDHRLWMFYRHWQPSSLAVQATLMIVHGTVDHSGVYRELAQRLNAKGIAVIAMDMRGWGKSDGEAIYFHDLDVFERDVQHLYHLLHDFGKVHQHVSKRFLLGKSIGGPITAACVARHPELWNGGWIGLSGAYAIDPSLAPPTIVMHIVHGLAACGWTKMHLPRKVVTHPKLLVKDEAAQHAFLDDPLCSKSNATVGYAVELSRVLKSIRFQKEDKDDDDNKNNPQEEIDLTRITCPVLLLCGTDDHVVTVKGHQDVARTVQTKDVELKTYDGGRHNLLQEPSLRERVQTDIMDWIVARI